ncbi:MAG TPA: hypothetical protein VL442_08875 [Mucilaginibacter sp.]|jgi:hypothetical protein|nr:hypothetical protein [Mucilaginibacter sp.]
MAQDYDFIIASKDDYDQVFIEIYFQGKFVAMINQEKGIDNLEIEFPGDNVIETLVTRKIPLEEFLYLLKDAKIKLLGN